MKNKIKTVIKEKYGVIIVLVYAFVVFLFALIKRGNIYVALTDNMDSNIPMLKMIRDNHLFWDFQSTIPFLGGCLGRAQYRVELSIQSWINILLPPLAAYYVIYLLKLLIASCGFLHMARSINKYDNFHLNENVWCICGAIYAILGSWPHAAIGFASIPWWVVNAYLIYKTKRVRYIFFSFIFLITTSFTMLALFLLFYYAIFILLVYVKNRRIHFPLLIDFLSLTIGFFLLNSHHVFQGIRGSSDTIKSIKQNDYSDSVFQSLRNLKAAILFKTSYYHTGGATLRYFVMPLCVAVVALLLIDFAVFSRLIHGKRNDNTLKNVTPHAKQSVLLKVLLSLVIIISLNAIFASFDNNRIFRKLIPFASGFSFSRFEWLSPFAWIVMFALVCELIILCFPQKSKYLNSLFICLAVLSIAMDPKYTALDSMYNDLYCNAMALVGNDKFADGNHEWTWNEYYSTELFENVKTKIDYDGEWAVAFGIEPSVLQYNGIRTLDGYYSNYSLEYHDVFQKLIEPELSIDGFHRDYWDRSYGRRAYIYSTEYDFVSRKNTDLQSAYMYIDQNVLDELNGKYVFSRFEIINYGELGLKLVLSEESLSSPYSVYVYKNEEGCQE